MPVRQVATVIVILTILFPYIRVLPLPTDVQPNFLIAIIICSPLLLSVRLNELVVFVGILCLLLSYTIANPEMQSFRGWPAYLTPPLVLFFTRSVLSKPESAPMLETVIRRSFYIWVGFGALQLVTHSAIVQLTLRTSTSADRGWMSFSGEPSAYASVLFLFAAYFVVKQSYVSAGIALLTVLVVAQSAVGLVYFVILALAWLGVRAHNHVLLVAIIVILVVVVMTTVDPQYVLDKLPRSRRITRLIEILLSPDAQLDDISITSRASDLDAAYDTLINGSPFGHGLGGVRLKSGWGSYVYELGWFGFALASGWIVFFLRQATRMGRDALAATVAIIAMLFSSTPLAMPMASFIVLAIILAPPDSATPDRRGRWRRIGVRSAHA
ncbi:hypothetical protein BMG00_13095 [Thioclava marina]|uniref:O-antigen ligase domain-containing protein n=2 Tax=Thioclava marina TaxID=1915077 RepID=A0ABX3MKV8_9RHOB|nr:hypothetical protein BMG00_13095 [Thioclava marina]